jgi:hypothetical protein
MAYFKTRYYSTIRLRIEIKPPNDHIDKVAGKEREIEQYLNGIANKQARFK